MPLRPVDTSRRQVEPQVQIGVVDHCLHAAKGALGPTVIEPLRTTPVRWPPAQQRNRKRRLVADQPERFLRIEDVEPQRIALARDFIVGCVLVGDLLPPFVFPRKHDAAGRVRLPMILGKPGQQCRLLGFGQSSVVPPLWVKVCRRQARRDAVFANHQRESKVRLLQGLQIAKVAIWPFAIARLTEAPLVQQEIGPVLVDVVKRKQSSGERRFGAKLDDVE